jgi:hypothetical protein
MYDALKDLVTNGCSSLEVGGSWTHEVCSAVIHRYEGEYVVLLKKPQPFNLGFSVPNLEQLYSLLFYGKASMYSRISVDLPLTFKPRY